MYMCHRPKFYVSYIHMDVLWLIGLVALVAVATDLFNSRSNYTTRGHISCADKGLVLDSSGRGCISKAYCEWNMNAQHENNVCRCGPGYTWDGLNQMCFVKLPWTTERNINVCQSKDGHIWRTPKNSPLSRGQCTRRFNVPMR
jgi:hypothetical protein